MSVKHYRIGALAIAAAAAALMTACGNRNVDEDRPGHYIASETDDAGLMDKAGDIVGDVVDGGREIASDVAQEGREMVSEAADAMDGREETRPARR